MSFSPLPDVIRTDLGAESDALTVELGAGDGRFTRILQAAGARVLVLDRRPGAAFALTDGVQAEGAVLPLRNIRLMVAANLLRHLWRGRGGPQVIQTWIECLAPGGRLYVFEDEPAAAPGPARNYRDLQTLLARIVPWRRGLLARREFETTVTARPYPGTWLFGGARNRFSPARRHDVLSLLVDAEGRIPETAEPLARKVDAEGVDYGHYWWARFERE